MAPVQPVIKPVDREEIEEALVALEAVDVDQANRLRATIDAYYLFAFEPWEIKDLLQAAAYRAGQLQVRCKEVAEEFERLGRGECGDEETE